jgi:hypothetical protein
VRGVRGERGERGERGGRGCAWEHTIFWFHVSCYMLYVFNSYM